jgi:hypothetical protein
MGVIGYRLEGEPAGENAALETLGRPGKGSRPGVFPRARRPGSQRPLGPKAKHIRCRRLEIWGKRDNVQTAAKSVVSLAGNASIVI